MEPPKSRNLAKGGEVDGRAHVLEEQQSTDDHSFGEQPDMVSPRNRANPR